VTEGLALDVTRLRQGTNLAADYPDSFVAVGRSFLWLERDGAETCLAVLSPPETKTPHEFHGRTAGEVMGRTLLLCPRDADNATRLRQAIVSLSPVPLGLNTSAGFGDRLGVATPGHIRAL
jgi:tagaturonate epimerase